MVNFNYSVNPSVFDLNTNNDNVLCGAIVYTSNTTSISFSGMGTVCYPLSAQLNISSQAGNIITMLADGAYASGSTSANGAYLYLSGGTLTGGLSGTSISATTFFGDGSHLTGISTVPIDARLTGATFNNNVLTLTNKSGGTISILINNLSGLTVNGSLSATTFFGNGSNLTGLPPEIYTTGGTFSNNNLIYTNNTGGTVSTVINNFTGLTVNGILSATTFFGNGSNLTGIVTKDTFETGSTFNNNNLILTNNTGGTITTLINNLSGLTVNGNVNINGGTLTQGNNNIVGNTYAHAEGDSNTANGSASHAEGVSNLAQVIGSHAEGYNNQIYGNYSHAEGYFVVMYGAWSHVEGRIGTCYGNWAHAEGYNSVNNADYSHTEGLSTQTNGQGAHAEGASTQANGAASHAEGASTIANGQYSHTEGASTITNGDFSHAEGINTIAEITGQHVSGRFNTTGNTGTNISIIGSGFDTNTRSDAFRVDLIVTGASASIITHNGNTILSGGTNPLQIFNLSSSTDSNILSIDSFGNVHKMAVSGITGGTSTGTSVSIDARLTGGTFTNNNLVLTNKSGGTVSTVINNFTGLTVNGIISATTISATTYFGNGANLTGLAPEIYTTGGTFSNNNLVYTNNTGGTVSTVINNFTGLTVNGVVSAATISATTLFVNGVQITGNTGSANTASTFTTAATYNAIAGTLNLTRNDGVTYSATGWNYVTGTTLSGNTIVVKNNTGGTTTSLINAATGGTFSNGTITLAGSGTLSTITGLVSANTFSTGVTFTNNTLAITRNDNVSINTSINSFTGLTVNGIVSATTVSATTLFANGVKITGNTATAAGAINQIQYNNGSSSLAASSLFTVDTTNQRISVSATTGLDAGLYAKNIGVGSSDTAAFRIENNSNYATLFITNGANTIPNTVGFFTNIGNGILMYPGGVNVCRYNTTVSVFYENGSCKVGFGITPSAQIHIAAGAAGANTAPIKLTTGTVNTTAETGAIEYASNQLTFVRSGTTRETIVITSATGATAPSNTATPVTWVNYVLGGVTYKMPLYQ